MRSRAGRILKGRPISAVALVAAIAALLAPASAGAVEPVLEVVVPGHSFPVAFTTEGGAVTAEMSDSENTVVHCTSSSGQGELTGPRSAVAKYVFSGCVAEHPSAKCQSASANPEEIKTEQIPAELVYISQAKHEVGILLNPGKDVVYMTFECGKEPVEARGPFLAPVGPVNQEVTSFTATLSELAGAQTPNEYENLRGEIFKAIPEGSREGEPFVTTGVASTITIHSAVSGMIRAISTEEVQAKRHEEEVQAKQHEEEVQSQHAADVKRQEEAAAKSHQEEAAASKKYAEEVAAAMRKQQEEEAAAAALKKKHQEEAAKKKRQLTKALKQCKRQPKHKRAQCEAKAKRRYGTKSKQKGK